MPSSRAALATIGAAPVPVPPPIPAVTNTMWAPVRWSRISSMTSSAAARPTSGCEPAPRPSVAPTPIWMMRSALALVSACASVLATTKSTPSSPALIMLLTALPPAPPTPNTVIRGFNSLISGIFRLMLMGASCWGGACRRLSPVRHRRCGSLVWCLVASETFAQPSSDPGHVAPRPCPVLPRMPRFEVFEVCRLGIDQKPSESREGRRLGDVRKAGDAERTPERHRTAEDMRGEIRQTGELAAAAGQHNAPARLGRERRNRQSIANHFENFLDPRPDDLRQGRARDRGWRDRKS